MGKRWKVRKARGEVGRSRKRRLRGSAARSGYDPDFMGPQLEQPKKTSFFGLTPIQLGILGAAGFFLWKGMK